MANIDYDRDDRAADCAKVPSMAAYAQMAQQPQQNPQSAQDYLNQQINRQAQQAYDEMTLMRAKQEQMRKMEREAEQIASLLLPPRAKVQGQVSNKCAIKTPEPKKHVADELMDAMEYLIADIKGNVLRNKALRGIETNYAIRRAQDALVAARASVKR